MVIDATSAVISDVGRLLDIIMFRVASSVD
jgi:hypothetical protein